MSDYLECPHCGGEATTSDDGMFEDCAGGRCEECGFPGLVSVDDADDENVTAYWNASDDSLARCTRADCEECRELDAEVNIELEPIRPRDGDGGGK